MVATTETVSVDRIFLDLDNPRHEPYKNEAEVIEYLCREEDVYALAKDIAKIGLNPLELFALIPVGKKKGSPAGFVVAEGNRRMCAIKLLHDPELAPASQRKAFEKLADKFAPVTKVLGVLFNNKEQVAIWLERTHGGVQDGIGRKPWNAEQKTRHIGDKKNAVAQFILDYAEERDFISPEERKGKLTTAQRYLSNALLREAMGVDSGNLDDISRTRPEKDFDLLVKTFVSDLVSGEVNSRSNSTEIKKYSRTLGGIDGLSGKRTAPESITVGVGKAKKRKKTPKKPEKQKHISYEEDIAKKLKPLGYKLEKIYYSLCDISLEDHTPLLSVGVWSFFECLTARAGRSSGVSFDSYLSRGKLGQLGFTVREDVNSIRHAIENIARYGNTTKHHDKSANFNGEQLANDMDVLRDVICKLAEEAK